jgi:hypothetical protein
VNVSYQVKRGVAASRSPGGPGNSFVALVLFQLPGEKVGRTLAINEELIRFQSGGDPKREDAVILGELKSVLAQMSAGTSIEV